MKALVYLVIKTLKNLVRGIFRKPSALIGFIVVFAFVSLLIWTNHVNPANIKGASSELFTGIVMTYFLFLYTMSLNSGLEKGSTYFRMADVNLVFTAPIKPGNILMYAFIRQTGGILTMLYFTLCLTPVLRENFALQPYGIWMIFASVTAFSLSYPLINMLLYSWVSKDNKRKKVGKYVLYVLWGSTLAIFLLDLARTRNIGASLGNVFDNPIAKYFPVIGWTGSIASAAVYGITTEVYVGTAGMVLLILGIPMTLFRLNLDFYEDVLEGTEYLEAVVKAKRTGNTMAFYAKNKGRSGNSISGKGARAILTKQFLEYKRTSFFFLFDVTTVIIIISSIVYRLISSNRNMSPDGTMFSILCFAIYMLFISQGYGRLNIEMEKPFIYLIPASASKKLFYATMPEHIKNLFDGMLLFALAGILFKAGLLTVLACIMAYVVLGSVFVYTSILARRIFGSIQSRFLLLIVKLIFYVIFLSPGIFAAAFAGAFTGNWFLGVLMMGGWSLIFALIFFAFSSGILNNIEARE